MKKLYLDDFRLPPDSFNHMIGKTNMENLKLYNEGDWVIVRNYNDFVAYIEKEGIPNVISFDHDLADEHYVPKEYWDNYEESKKYQDDLYPQYKEKTGYDCAVWLIEKLDQMELSDIDLNILVHSMNPVGTDRIHKAFSDLIKRKLSVK